jgi:hypothetical protein
VKSFKNQAAQGDILLRRISKLPDGLFKKKPCGLKYVVAHSETGHHHTIDAIDEVTMWESADAFIAYITIEGDCDVELRHERSFDTHESILISPGVYEIRRQREYTPEGYRRVID